MTNSYRERIRAAWARGWWHAKIVRAVGMPDYRIGAKETLPHEANIRAIRIAPSRLGQPVASFWLFKFQGDEIYVAGRTHMGVHKLSFHKSGKSYTTLRGERKELAAWKMLDGGRWLHAVQLRYLIGTGLLRPLPEKPFKEPGFLIESPPGQYFVVHMLIGTEGTTLEMPLPRGYGFPRLLPMQLRGGRCAWLVGGPITMTPEVQRDLALLQALRIQVRRPVDPLNDSLETFQVEVTGHGFNRVTVVPLGPENFTMSPRPSDAQSVPVDWFTS